VNTNLPALGVLGGMGPLATADFMRKLVEATPATCDQDHIPVFVHSVPQIPDRSEAYLHGSDAPWPYLVAGLRTLEASGAQAIAMPCNTAHLWHTRLASETALKVLHIGAEASRAVAGHAKGIKRVGLLATTATVQGEIYQHALHSKGVTVVTPAKETQVERVMKGIAAVKGGQLEHAEALLHQAAEELLAAGVEGLILGCTELPLVLSKLTMPFPCSTQLNCWYRRACPGGRNRRPQLSLVNHERIRPQPT